MMKEQLEDLIDQMYRGGLFYSEALREFKKKFILRVLTANRGNQCKAAREMGIHRNTLSRTIAELKIDGRNLRGFGKTARRVHRAETRARMLA